MRNKLLATLLFVVVLPSSVSAQTDKNPYNFSQFWRETGQLFTEPLHWEADDWLKLGIVAGATGLSTLADQSTRTKVMGAAYIANPSTAAPANSKYYHNPLIEGGRIYGELYSPIVLFAGFAAFSLITGDKTTRKIGYELGQSALYAGGFVFLLKVLVGRSRPLTNEGPGHFRPSFSIVDDNFHSFPSGHSAVSMVISTVLARNVDPLWAKILCYVPAVATMCSRIYQDQHWVSDVVAGGAIGFFFATWACDHHDENEAAGKTKSAIQTTIFPPSITIALN
jgi:membrane-associated phospholipid phosphatase